jgi:His/Glu/Gln/Arg/opine family amino acid ABC transporter permease subunit
MNYQFSFRVIEQNLPYILSGLGNTLFVTGISIVGAALIAIGIGIAEESRIKLLTIPMRIYVEVFRNTPVLVQLMWIYYCMPIFLGVGLEAMTSAIVALTLCASAYLAEIVRAGIQSVDTGEVEASRAIGMSRLQTMRRIVLPQALVTMIPALINTFVSFLKYSALVSVIGVADLTYRAQVLSSTTFRPLEFYTAIAVIYFTVCSGVSLFGRWAEKRLAI